MAESFPPWPSPPPASGSIVLRAFTDDDVHLALALGADPYVPHIGTLPAHPTREQAADWVRRQRERYTERTGLSFAVADAATDRAVGTAGLSLRTMATGRANAGYAVPLAHRGRGVASSALRALTAFAWTIPELHRLELNIEPWNHGSVRVAESAGYEREGLLRSYQEINGVRRDMLLYATIRP
ncbi:GNAT family protein [Actinokineospora sp. NBRC 105648]|uniref:GNAT family N-acetyltransferase n=1 Tax=Actinokineospora sp. NBRC 105648 TaxID=3032206 RepID=UPI0024A040E0|nr:GNAT family protein [Actinokineospora sp. NBRC 105648]GLZ41149.1 N-acetyltransferase [Actinokineospora sp. NBRC 105648]